MSWLADMLDTTVSYALPAGISGNDLAYGEVQTGAPAKVNEKRELVRGVDGDELVGTHVIATLVELPAETQVWTVDQDPNTDDPFVVIATRSARSFDGLTYYKAVCA